MERAAALRDVAQSPSAVSPATFSHAEISARTPSRWPKIAATASSPSGNRKGVCVASSAARIAAAALAGSPGWDPSPPANGRDSRSGSPLWSAGPGNGVCDHQRGKDVEFEPHSPRRRPQSLLAHGSVGVGPTVLGDQHPPVVHVRRSRPLRHDGRQQEVGTRGHTAPVVTGSGVVIVLRNPDSRVGGGLCSQLQADGWNRPMHSGRFGIRDDHLKWGPQLENNSLLACRRPIFRSTGPTSSIVRLMITGNGSLVATHSGLNRAAEPTYLGYRRSEQR